MTIDLEAITAKELAGPWSWAVSADRHWAVVTSSGGTVVANCPDDDVAAAITHVPEMVAALRAAWDRIAELERDASTRDSRCEVCGGSGWTTETFMGGSGRSSFAGQTSKPCPRGCSGPLLINSAAERSTFGLVAGSTDPEARS